MSRMKGTVAIWIWIIGGLIVGIMTLLAAYTNLSQVGTQTARQNVVSSFNDINSDIDFLCSQAPGARKTKDVSLRDVRAIYASEDKSEPTSEAPDLISEGETAQGQYTCLTFVSGHYGCVEHSCPVEMTWIGRPLPGSDMHTLGSEDGLFDFKLRMRKTSEDKVVVEAEHLP